MTSPSPAVPHTDNPLLSPRGPAAIDYRQDPNAGSIDHSQVHAATYDHPLTADDHPVAPWVDQTWAAYDEATDASRFRGINSPEQQAALHLSPQGKEDAQGFSPSLPNQLQWERSGPDGSPPQ